jgi:hypothetical protein
MGLKNSRLLKLSADPFIGYFSLSQAQQVDCLAEKRSAMIGLGLARNNIHHGRFASTIGADKATQLASINRERQLIEGTKSIKTNRDVFEIKNWSMRSVNTVTRCRT